MRTRQRSGGWCLGAVMASGLSVGAGPLTLSVTFDDTHDNQYLAREVLLRHGVPATFYVNAPRIDRPAFMTREQVEQLAADGHEIGGHSAHHFRVPDLGPEEQLRQVCADRNALIAMGFHPVSFAYPYGAFSEDAMRAVELCGYGSGRAVGGLAPSSTCPHCPRAEAYANPPRRFAIRTPASVHEGVGLEELIELVEEAERGTSEGDWLILVFHHVRDGRQPYSIDVDVLDAFLGWVAGREIRVRTVAEVMGGGFLPTFEPPAPPPRAPEGNLLENPSFEEPDPSGLLARCWHAPTSAGWRRSNRAKTGRGAVAVTTERAPARITSRQDLGECAPTAAPGHRYRVEASYTATAEVRLLIYYRTAQDHWVYWTRSPALPAAEEYTEVTWETPKVPAEAMALGIALSLEAPGAATVDDMALYDLGEGSGCRHTGGSNDGSALVVAFAVLLLLGLRVRP